MLFSDEQINLQWEPLLLGDFRNPVNVPNDLDNHDGPVAGRIRQYAERPEARGARRGRWAGQQSK